MSHTDTEAPVSELDYNTVADSIIAQAEERAWHVPRGATVIIEYSYKDTLFHDPAVAMYLTVKIQPRDIRYDGTLFGMHRFTIL